MFMPTSYLRYVKGHGLQLMEYQYGAINNMIRSREGRRSIFTTHRCTGRLITCFTCGNPSATVWLFIWRRSWALITSCMKRQSRRCEYFQENPLHYAAADQAHIYYPADYSLGSIMKGNFELFYQTVGNNGLLYDVTDILDTYVYRITVGQPLSIGLGSAAGLFQSIFGFVVVMVTNWAIKKKILSTHYFKGEEKMQKEKTGSKIKSSTSNIVFNILAYSLVAIVSIVCVLPFLLVVSGSFTDNGVIVREGYSCGRRFFPWRPTRSFLKILRLFCRHIK